MLSLAAFCCGRVHAQATVTGGQGTYIYVDGQSGSNSNPGSSSQPLKTIQASVNAALADNAHGIAVVVSIKPGVYRESVTMGGTHTSAPITIQAATPGTVYIDGADILSKYSSQGNGIYAYSWTDNVSGCVLPNNWYTGMPPVVLANEMVFVNGAPLTQVMSKSQLVPGTFYVDNSYQQIDLDPASGTDMSSAKVEAASRRTTLTVNSASNLVLRGLVLQHAASCININGANINSGSNILIDNVQANWNNWGGLGVNSSDHVTVQNSTASYNGGVGIGAFEDTHSLFSNNESDYNNWRGEMVGLYDFAQGGTKIMHGHAVTVTGQQSYNNGAQGLWFDTDNMNIEVSGAKLAGNLVDNLQLEASQGPITVENSSFCSGGVGVNLLESEGVTLTGNHFYANGGNIPAQNGQVFLSGKTGGRLVTNYETGVTTNEFTSNTTIKQKTFTAVGSQQYVFNTYLSGNDWSQFINSLNSGGNNWFNASNPNDFGLPGGKKTNFAGWQSVSGDTTSSWSLAGSAQSGCGIPVVAYADFNILAHNAAAYVSSYTMAFDGTLSIPLQVRSFGFGIVTLSAPNLPTGVSASFSPATLVSGNSTLALTAYSSATAQKVPITIFATSGSRVHTITLWVTVKPGTKTAPSTVPATPKISANPSTVSVSGPGSAGTTSLALSGFDSSSFKFSCSGLPKGASCIFGAVKGSGISGTVSLKITTSAPSTAMLVSTEQSGSRAILAFAVPGLIAIFALFATRRRYPEWNKMIALVLATTTGIFLSSCGVTPGLGGHPVAASSGPTSSGSGSGSGSSSGSAGNSGSSGSSNSGSGPGSGSGSSSNSGSSSSSGSGSTNSGSGSSSNSGSGSGSGSKSGSSSSGSSSGSSGSGTSGGGSSSGSGSSGSGSNSGGGSSSGSGSGTTSPTDPGTPSGTNSVIVTAISGNQSATVTLTLKVN